MVKGRPAKTGLKVRLPGPEDISPRIGIVLFLLALGVALLVLSASMLTASVSPVQAQKDQSWREDFRLWQAAVVQHVPGTLDESAEFINNIPSITLEQILARLAEMIKFLGESRPGDAPRLLGLTNEETSRHDASRFLKHAAMAHTDVALLAPWRNWLGTRIGRQSTILVRDGVSVGPDSFSHWEIARQLLDLIHPSPAIDDMVRQWYIATSTVMQANHLWGPAMTNLKRARQIFPLDGDLFLLSGALHEYFASPAAQNAVPPRGTRFDISPEVVELKAARDFLQDAAKLKSHSADPHLRLGRVSGLLGDHMEALSELKQAQKIAADDRTLYFASLFLGSEYESLQQSDNARVQFTLAASIFPNAQSPWLGLSHLARFTGNLPDALAAMDRALRMRGVQDPWWEYWTWQARDAEKLMAAIRKTIGGLPK